MTDRIDRAHIVRLARQLERARAKRRALMKQLRAVDGEIRDTQKFLRDLVGDVDTDTSEPTP